ncbi:hypothetical protein M8542_49390 [Amycolatopsis sp. OK19-0408]|uniref:Uncharacterized protein n=1 Tax=Amycolatopsis iheyensis TaxID=2945988 RepID=A0A9X2NMQ9_9PSEU|nr:hypothetical protein [Amycolatopsis iheyensis]MCR6490827.1 hypothetical protein [Amycolatopsis iheyensis]
MVRVNDQTVNDGAAAPFGGIFESDGVRRFGATVNVEESWRWPVIVLSADWGLLGVTVMVPAHRFRNTAPAKQQSTDVVMLKEAQL